MSEVVALASAVENVTLTAWSLGFESETVNGRTVVVPASPSRVPLSATEIDGTASSLPMVPTPSSSAMVRKDANRTRTWNVSSASCLGSPRTSTVTGVDVDFAGSMIEPPVAV